MSTPVDQHRIDPDQERAVGVSAERTDPKLLELLVCPVTRMALIYDAARQELVSRAASLAYPICHGVPMLSPAAARPLEEAEIEALRLR